MANTYIACSKNGRPVEFDGARDRPVPDMEFAYFIRGFRILERAHEFDGYTVCFTWGSTTPIPRLGPRVVAAVTGDEHCRVPAYAGRVGAVLKSPAYAGRVGAVLKSHGLFPKFVPPRRPLRQAEIEATELLRNLALWAPAGWRLLLSKQVRARCHVLPLGYGIARDFPATDFGRRRYITSFLGSLTGSHARRPVRTAIGIPKACARARLAGVLGEPQRRYGVDRVPVSISPSFQDSLSQGGRGYAEVMSDTQICLAPRGTAHETLRLYEGLKAGCVVLADQLPRHPFYEGSPVIQIEDWRDLPDLVEGLLRDPARMRDLHERGLCFWREVLSPEALARRYAAILGLREGPAAGAAANADDGLPAVPEAHTRPPVARQTAAVA